MANRVHDEDAGDMETIRSEATLAIGDDVSLGDASIATLEDFSSPANTQALRNQKVIIENLNKENAELRRHVKRRTQALDTIRRSYIIDVERLKRGVRDQAEAKSAAELPDLDEAALEGIPSLDFRPVLELFAPTGDKLQVSPCDECGGTLEIVHYDDKEIVKLRLQIDTLRDELQESGKTLSNSKAVAETYRLKAENSSAEFSELNNMLLREIKVLKDKLVDSGPEVVKKISEEKDKAESRLRSAHRAVSELEAAVVEVQGQLERATEDTIKVAEMEHHLLESSKELKAMESERDMHASAVDELRATVASLREDVREAGDRNDKLLKSFQDHEENNRQSQKKLRKLLENSKTSEASLMDELAALKEENLHLSLAGDCDDYSTTDERRRHQESAAGSDERSPTGGFFTAFYGEPEPTASPQNESDKMLAFELTEKLRRKDEELEYLRNMLEKQKAERERAIDKGLLERELEAAKKQAGAVRSTVESTAAVGEDILSGAYARREEEATAEIAGLKALLVKAQDKARKVERENKKLLKMWNTTRARLSEAEGAREAGETPLQEATYPRKAPPSQQETVETAASGRPRKRTRRSTRKGDPLANADNGKSGGLLGPPIRQPDLDSAAEGGAGSSPRPTQTEASTNSVSDRSVDALGKNAASTPGSAVDAADCSDDDDVDVMGVAITYLEEDCRLLRAQKGELQEKCTGLKAQSQDLVQRLGEAQRLFEKERQGKQESDRALEERRELLSKATLAVAEHSMALHDAQEGTEKVKKELELEKQDTANLRQKLTEMGAVNSVLEAGLAATNASLELVATGKREAEATAERNASQAKRNAAEADRNALRAEGNASWANAEGLRAEEAISRRFLSDMASAEKVAALGAKLEKSENEVKRRRRDAKEHAEQMKEFRQTIAEKAKLEEEVACQHDTIMSMQKKTANDQAVIEELTLQVGLLDSMRKEVLRLEAKVERLQKELLVATTSLEGSKKKHKVTERELREKVGLSRNLWAALVGTLVLVDDWCSGPLLAWRETDSALKPSVLPKPPFEARGVDEIMKLKKVCSAAAEISSTTATSPPPPDVPGTDATSVSIQDKLEGLRPNCIRAWLEFRLQVVASMDHSDRVDSSRSEQLLLESICKQRAAQIQNMEEAHRKLEATRAGLQEAYDELCVVKEELSNTVVKQNEALLENSKELLKYAALMVDHESEVRQHEKAARCLDIAQGNIKSLNKKLSKAVGVAAMAENAAREAEEVRNAAVEEREAAVSEAKITRETMERGKKEAESVKKQLHDLVQADETRLATNKGVATEVTYGDFTEEAGTMTTFLCPELTMRQLRRPPASRSVPESVGRVVPALKVLPDTRLGYQGPHDYRLREDGGKRWKQPSCTPSSTRTTSGSWPLCGTPQAGQGASWTNGAQQQHTAAAGQTLLCGASDPKTDEVEAHGWTFGWNKNVMTLPLIA